jgi:hypothetical protein
MKKGVIALLTEAAIRKVIARALTTLGRGQVRPDDVPSRMVVAMQTALESGRVSLPVAGGLDIKSQTALVSGILGLTALSTASNESERLSAAFQMRKAAAEAATA